jgi:hypothetical protein
LLPKGGKMSPHTVPKVSQSKGKSVDWYIEKTGGWQAETIAELHGLILDAVPGIEHGIKWAQPVYESDGPALFIRSAKNHVTLGFWRGVELMAPSGILEGEGGKMRHIKFPNSEAVDKTLVRNLVKQAVRLNQEKGDPTKKS